MTPSPQLSQVIISRKITCIFVGVMSAKFGVYIIYLNLIIILKVSVGGSLIYRATV